MKQSTKTLGYTLGGPIGKPGGNNKLFFFYSHEYRPVTAPINGGNPIRIRVPTALERAGDFSQTRDNTGALFNLIKDPNSSSPCTAASTAGCFQAGGVLGKIPADRLYSTGLALLSRYPLPNVTQGAGQNYNYEAPAATTDNLTQQPAIRIDYQASSNLRITGKYNGQRARKLVTPGTIDGFNDVLNPYPFITNYGVTANWTVNNSMYRRGDLRLHPQPARRRRLDRRHRHRRHAGEPVGQPVERCPAFRCSTRTPAWSTIATTRPPSCTISIRAGTATGKISLPPAFGWGSRIMGTAGVGALPGVPNQVFPGYLNINRTQDFAVSLTKVWGTHTSKAGFYNNHSFKAQNTGAGGVANLGFQGYVNFGNDTNNALDTGFGYANAAVGVFQQYLQQSKLIEGSMIYNNTEFYVQDNWKVNGRLTLDYGVRFTRQQPQYDQFLQMSNFFPNEWSKANAPLLYVVGLQQRGGRLFGQRAQRGRSAHRADPHGARRGQHRGGDRHRDPGHRQPDQRHPSGGQRHRGHVLRLADAGRGAALRHGLRPERRPVDGAARGRRALLRPSGRQHRLLDSRQPADLDVAGSAQRPAADAGHRSQHDRRAGADRLPVQRPAALVVAVAGRRADGAALVDDASTSPTSATTASTACARSRAGPTARST